MSSELPQKKRLPYLDWARGFAAVIMLQGHVFHSFTSTELRSGPAYVLSQFIGGFVPALFLFLTGVTLGFMMVSRERKGEAPSRRVWYAVKRGAYLLGLAFLFRLQLWIFAWPGSPWTDLFKVDILNLMGTGIIVMSVMAVFSTAERVRLCGILGMAIAFVSPFVSQLDWSHTPALLKHYIAPDYNYFSFFPWASFLAFGISGGSLLRLTKSEDMNRLMQWAVLLGLVLITASSYFSQFPYSLYSQSEYWLNSPWLQFNKLGVILFTMAFAYLWTTYATRGWSWVQQFGMTSLLVYWVHIELVYGRWFGVFHTKLNVTQTVAVAVVVTLLMLGLSVLRTNWKNWKTMMPWSGFRISFERASGD